jgi:hypothetical protein
MGKQIALYVEGDLPARKASAVEAHLAECAACRELVDALSASQSALRSLRGEAADPLLLDQVRSRVMAEIQTQPPRPMFGWAWRFALAATLIALLAGGTYLWRNPRPQAPRRTEIVRLPETPPVPPPTPIAPVKPHRVHHRSKPARIAPEQKPAASGALVVKLFTDDPNVVILLVSENGG